MSFETDALTRLIHNSEDCKSTLVEINETMKAFHETLKMILAACEGDGSGELVAVLRKLGEAVSEVSIKVDALPPVLVDALEQAASN